MGHLNKPLLLQRLRDLPTANGPGSIPATATAVLSSLEVLSNIGGLTQIIPQNILCNIYRALKLSQDEKISVMPLIERETGVLLAEIWNFTRKRHQTFSMYQKTLQKTEKEYKDNNPTKRGNATSGAGAFGTESKVANGRGGRGSGAPPKGKDNLVLGVGSFNVPKGPGGQGRGVNGKKEGEKKSNRSFSYVWALQASKS